MFSIILDNKTYIIHHTWFYSLPIYVMLGTYYEYWRQLGQVLWWKIHGSIQVTWNSWLQYNLFTWSPETKSSIQMEQVLCSSPFTSNELYMRVRSGGRRKRSDWKYNELKLLSPINGSVCSSVSWKLCKNDCLRKFGSKMSS